MNLVTNASEAIGVRDGVDPRDHAARGDKSGSPGATPERLPEGDYLKLVVSDTGERHVAGNAGQSVRPVLHHQSPPAAGSGLRSSMGLSAFSAARSILRANRARAPRFRYCCLAPRLRLRQPTAAASGNAEAARPSQSHHSGCGRRRSAAASCRRRCSARRAIPSLRLATGPRRWTRFERESPIDVLFLDVTLPGTPSWNVLEEARRIRPEMRVIVTSAYSKELAEEALGAPIALFIRKPYRLAELTDLLRQAML